MYKQPRRERVKIVNDSIRGRMPRISPTFEIMQIRRCLVFSQSFQIQCFQAQCRMPSVFQEY